MSLNIEKFWSARPTDKEAMTLLRCSDDYSLIELSKAICDDGYGDMMTYSPKVFIPLTVLCRDMCHYCTFARKPKEIQKGFLMKDRLLRPSLVGVSKKKVKKEQNSSENKENSNKKSG